MRWPYRSAACWAWPWLSSTRASSVWAQAAGVKASRANKRAEGNVRMVGVGETLADGETLGLLVYGYNLQFFTSLSRDLLVPAVTLSGTVDVPLLNP